MTIRQATKEVERIVHELFPCALVWHRERTYASDPWVIRVGFYVNREFTECFRIEYSLRKNPSGHCEVAGDVNMELTPELLSPWEPGLHIFTGLNGEKGLKKLLTDLRNEIGSNARVIADACAKGTSHRSRKKQ